MISREQADAISDQQLDIKRNSHALNARLIRTLESPDYEFVASVVDDWWGGRPVRALVHRIFFEHLNATSFAIGPSDAIQAFLIGFVSQSDPKVAYIHFVGVSPAARAGGLARTLYEHFFNVVGAKGCTEVQSITSVVNTGSIEFHRKLGFTLLPGSGEINGIPVVLNYAGEGQHRVRFHKSL
ncbi:Predicted acetyltransferase, GNAT superfamily [Collimonas sp. OK242]|uniref:GNAT family N-acetyltransferase n=1 Tax=Collimonas sp. OK242 TaxID=1798195 RepID=UPI0008976A99|nr:GNAT family N-acetyltransferase [Collimonas sp. OK242]SDX60578.1 Predicted acetyltransferase, GNAT superfamily [Collimonas sp. OK242]